MQVLVGDFTRRSTGDVLLHEATVRNQATSVLDLFAQDGNGRMLRVQSPTTGQWTGPVPGPRFLSGTPIAVPAGQDPAAIVQIDRLSLDTDGRFDDVVARTSTGKLLVFPNHGQSAYGAGFPDLDGDGAHTLFDFADPANGFGIASLQPIYSCLGTGDFDGNGGVPHRPGSHDALDRARASDSPSGPVPTAAGLAFLLHTPRHHLRPQTRRWRQHPVIRHQVLALDHCPPSPSIDPEVPCSLA